MVPIKTLGPDLIVIPYNNPDSQNAIEMSLKRIHCLVIGPGMSRSKEAFDHCKEFVARIKDRPIIIDGVYRIFI